MLLCCTCAHNKKCINYSKSVYSASNVMLKTLDCALKACFWDNNYEKRCSSLPVCFQSSIFCLLFPTPCGQASRLYTPDNQAFKLQIGISLNSFPSADWKRRPGRPHGRWVDQLRQDNHSPVDLWHSAIMRGHPRATATVFTDCALTTTTSFFSIWHCTQASEKLQI